MKNDTDLKAKYHEYVEKLNDIDGEYRSVRLFEYWNTDIIISMLWGGLIGYILLFPVGFLVGLFIGYAKGLSRESDKITATKWNKKQSLSNEYHQIKG